MTGPSIAATVSKLAGRISVRWAALRPAAHSAAASLTGGRRRVVLLVAAGGLVLGAAFLARKGIDPSLTASVRRGDLHVRITASGALKPAQSITYRSPLAGREAELVFLVAEGTPVNEGDLLARVDVTEVQRELERAVQELRQAQVELQVAELERQDGVAAVESLAEGAGALGIDEVRSQLRLTEKKAERQRAEYEGLRPLMEKGFITREELERTAFDLEQTEAELALARRKAEVTVERSHPRDRQRASLQLAQKQAQAENARARVREAQSRLKQLQEAIQACSIYARAPGLVVHEEFLGAGLRRKVRVGDRVTGTQGLVTIPEVSRMLVETSVPEADVHRVNTGQPATIRLDAFPGHDLKGHVARIGALARAAPERPSDLKRFDVVVELEPGAAVELRPEMTARVDLLVDERTNALLVPVNAVFERPGSTVCHVVRAFGIETRTVVLGASDGAFVEVVSGLQAGRRVTLVDVSPRAEPSSAAGSGDAPQKVLMQGVQQEVKPLGPR